MHQIDFLKKPKTGALVLGLCAALMAVTASTALAGNINGLTYTDSSSQDNALEVTRVSSTTIRVVDTNATLTENSSSCTVVSGGVQCTVSSSGSSTFAWNLGGGEDNLWIDVDVNVKDSVNGGAGFDVANGSLGPDVFVNSADGDTMVCDDGDDTVNYTANTTGVTIDPNDGMGYDGAIGEYDFVDPSCENLLGGSGPDVIDGSDGAPGDIIGANGNDVLKGSLNNTSTDCNSGPSYITGDAGNDWIEGRSGANKLLAGTGDDYVLGSDEDCDYIYGSNGNDVLIGKGGNDDIVEHQTETGTSNVIVGGAGADIVAGGAGSDKILALENDSRNDQYSCNAGTDEIFRDNTDSVHTIWGTPGDGSCETEILVTDQ